MNVELSIPRSGSVAQAAPARIFRIASLQEQARLFVTFLVKIVKQLRRGVFRKLAGQVIETREKRQKVRLGIRFRHPLHGGIQLDQGLKDGAFRLAHIKNESHRTVVKSENGPPLSQ